MYAHTAVTVSDCITLLLRRGDKRKGRKSSSSSALYLYILTQAHSIWVPLCLSATYHFPHYCVCFYNLALSSFLCHLVAPHTFYFPVLFISCSCSFACQPLSSSQTFGLSICLSACPRAECVFHLAFSVTSVWQHKKDTTPTISGSNHSSNLLCLPSVNLSFLLFYSRSMVSTKRHSLEGLLLTPVEDSDQPLEEKQGREATLGVKHMMRTEQTLGPDHWKHHKEGMLAQLLRRHMMLENRLKTQTIDKEEYTVQANT